MFFLLGRLATRFRWLIVGLWMVAIAIALPFAPQVTQVLQSGGFVSPDFESQRAILLLTQKLHFNPTIVQVIFTSSRYSADSPEFTQETQQALTRVRGWSEVSGVISFTDNPRQISLDRHDAYVNVLLKPDPDTAPKLVPELERRLQAVPDLQTHIGGGPVFFADIQLVSERDLRRAEILAFPFALIALLLVFRSVVAAVLPALVGGSAVGVTLALIFGLGHLTTFSIFVLNITTLFGLGLGVDYSLFMVSRFREELAHGRSVDDAVAISVATAGRAVTFSGLTVSIGLLGLTFFRLNMLHSVGVGGILVVVLAVLAALTLLPAALTIIGTKINAFPIHLPQFRKREEVTAVGTADATPGSLEHHGFWYRLSHLVMRYPLQVFVPVFLLLVALGLPFLGVRFSAPDASILPTNVPSRAAFDLLAKRFNDRETTPILIAVQTRGDVLSPTNVDKLYSYVQRIQADPRVARVDSIVSADPRFTLDQYELLYTHPQLIADPYLSALVKASAAGNTLEILVISKYGMLDQRSQALVQAIRNTTPGSGNTILVDGGTAGGIDYVDSLYTDFPKAVVVVALTTYIVLLLLFRSLVLPLKAILMNTLSILASYGALVVIFQDGFLHQVLGFTPLGFVEASSPILLFFALFGLSMDYEVFLLSRVQEAFWQTGDNTHAVTIGLQQSGGIITSAAIIFDQRRLIEPGTIIPNGTSTSGLRVSIGDWSVQGVNGQDHLAAEMANYSMHVDVLGLKPAVLHNGNGLITYGLGGFSYYYSRTRMALSGRLIDHKQSLRVNGVVWMDHQWGNFLTLGGGGWDWFSIQLNNNTEMMLYLIRDATGKTVSTYVEEIGSRADVHLLPPGALHVDVLNHWKSPVTGVNYPSGWHLEVNSQQLQAELSLTPELKDQELVVYQSTGNTYWEGAVSIQGQSAGQDVQGEGYVELTGYSPVS